MLTVTRVRDSLDSDEIRNACAALDHVHEALKLIDRLSPQSIEAIHDKFAQFAREHNGPRGSLKQAIGD